MVDPALCAHVAVVSLLRVMCCVSGDASRLGRTLASRLKELLDRQQYEVIIQVGGGRGVLLCGAAYSRCGVGAGVIGRHD